LRCAAVGLRSYTGAMAAAGDDWRRTGQEEYLAGARLTWKNYQPLSAQWEHEHCEFCWHKFLDPHYSPADKELLEREPDAQSAAGYTNLADEGRPAGKWWICEGCFADFKEEFGWTVVQTDPDAWPYDGPEPEHRFASADYTPPDGLLPRPE
jgi:hypothetical protein